MGLEKEKYQKSNYKIIKVKILNKYFYKQISI